MNKNPKERTEYIGIRVTPEEKEMITKLAKAAGLTLTGYLVGQAIGDKLGELIVNSKKRKD